MPRNSGHNTHTETALLMLKVSLVRELRGIVGNPVLSSQPCLLLPPVSNYEWEPRSQRKDVLSNVSSGILILSIFLKYTAAVPQTALSPPPAPSLFPRELLCRALGFWPLLVWSPKNPLLLQTCEAILE